MPHFTAPKGCNWTREQWCTSKKIATVCKVRAVIIFKVYSSILIGILLLYKNIEIKLLSKFVLAKCSQIETKNTTNGFGDFSTTKTNNKFVLLSYHILLGEQL